MAAVTFLDGITSDTVSSAVLITGDVDFSGFGSLDGGHVEIQRAVLDTDDFHWIGPEGRWSGPGHVSVRNVGSNYYRVVATHLGPNADYTVKSNQ